MDVCGTNDVCINGFVHIIMHTVMKAVSYQSPARQACKNTGKLKNSDLTMSTQSATQSVINFGHIRKQSILVCTLICVSFRTLYTK